MRILNVVLGLGLLVVTSQAFAEETKADQAAEAVKEETQAVAQDAGAQGATSGGEAKYGPAGCGLGSLIFSPDSGWTQIFAGTTNGTSGNQTFGITSGTSNCDTGPSKKSSAKNYIQANRAQLAKDIARGKGATLNGLSEVAGCSDAKAVSAKLHHNFKVIFPSAQVESEAVGDSVVGVLKSDGALSCSNLG